MAKLNIIGRVKDHAEKVADERRERRRLKELQLQEEKLRKIKEEEEKAATAAQQIQQEKERLLQLNKEEMLVEAIFAIRGFYNEFLTLKEEQRALAERVEELESDVEALSYSNYDEDDIKELRSEIDQLKENIRNNY